MTLVIDLASDSLGALQATGGEHSQSCAGLGAGAGSWFLWISDAEFPPDVGMQGAGLCL